MTSEQRGAGVGPFHLDPVDRRNEGLTPEGFDPKSVAILDAEEYDLLLRVASELGHRTKHSLAVLTPQFQAQQDGAPLDPGQVRVIKSGELYDDVFEPLRQMREEMVKEGTSEDLIERTIARTLEGEITHLNEESQESQDESRDALR